MNQISKNKGFETERSELRKFGLLSGFLVLLIFCVILPWIFETGIPSWPILVALILGALALAHPESLYYIYKPWMKFGVIAGTINSRIIITLLFYLVMMPMGIVMKIFRIDPMSRSFDETLTSYRIDSRTKPENNMENPY